MYDYVRPGYPAAVLDAIVRHHGGRPASVAEIGAGTGKGTELFVRLGAPVTCIEPDPRMAAVPNYAFATFRTVLRLFQPVRASHAPSLASRIAYAELVESPLINGICVPSVAAGSGMFT